MILFVFLAGIVFGVVLVVGVGEVMFLAPTKGAGRVGASGKFPTVYPANPGNIP